MTNFSGSMAGIHSDLEIYQLNGEFFPVKNDIIRITENANSNIRTEYEVIDSDGTLLSIKKKGGDEVMKFKCTASTTNSGQDGWSFNKVKKQ